jgi:uncharacterized membrane protein
MHLFDMQHTLLAKHAQHIVLVHFPIALTCVALLLELVALASRNSSRDWSAVAYCNLSIAAAAVFPVLLTGLIAWKWQLEDAPLHGVLRLHLLLGLGSSVMIWTSWFLAFRERRGAGLRNTRLAVEIATVAVVAVTAHVGGFVSGVNL